MGRPLTTRAATTSTKKPWPKPAGLRADEKNFTEGSYEVTNSRIKSGGGELLVETAISLLKELKP